jgi:hypothetical protein
MPRLNLVHEDIDHIPFRENIRRKAMSDSRSWSFSHHYIKVRNKSVWGFINLLLTNSIGKPFDVVFSKFCHEAPVQYQQDFLDEFVPQYKSQTSDYYIDENGLIQESEHVIQRRIERREERKRPYIRRSHDWQGGYINKITGSIISLRDARWYYSDSYLKENHKYGMISGSEWKVQKGSAEDKRYYYEDKTKYKAKLKAERTARKEKRYSFKTKTEIEAKMLLEKTRLENNNNILRHGFDNESFRGEHYHGRKNKKKSHA